MKDGTRFSTQRAYVYPASRRPNLTIRSYSTATKVQYIKHLMPYFEKMTFFWHFQIEFDDSNRAIGIHYETVKADGSSVKRYASAKKEIILRLLIRIIFKV